MTSRFTRPLATSALAATLVCSITLSSQALTTINADTISTGVGAGIVLAQGEIRIPSDAQLERMEEQGIATPPLDVRDAPGRGLSEGAQIRQMDERARRIDERLMGGDAICADCE
jgi:hypothetical protein